MTVGVILAGGRSTRMGHDKAFVHLNGRPLIEHAIESLAPQVAHIAINSNADASLFARYRLPVFADAVRDIGGPLAGIYTALMLWPNDDVVTVAVDLPLLPDNLVARLRRDTCKLCRYASDGEQHALAIRWAPHSAAALRHYLESGRRDLRGWLQTHGEAVTISADSAFNVNTPQELTDAERLLSTFKVDAA